MALSTCGIDLGTTFSCAAISKDGKTDVIPTNTGKSTVPSFVSFCGNEIIIGEAAKAKASTNLKNTVYDAKRMIGHRFDDRGVQEDMKHWGFVVERGSNNECLIKVEYKGAPYSATPQEISGHVLRYLADNVEAKYGVSNESTIHAVITVPAYFSDAQRRATINAGELAGLNVLQVINEPTAAAIAYGYKYFVDHTDRTILVYDFGGGTFDVSIITVKDKKISVKATGGDTHLGGEDINQNLLNYYVEKIKKEGGEDISNNKKKLWQLRKAIEDAKINLSVSNSIEVDSGCLEDNDIDAELSRAEFNKINKKLFEKTIDIVKNVLDDSGLSKKDIDDIVLIGGSSKIPKVQELLSDYFGGKTMNKDINPDEAVAVGASILAEDILRGVKERKGRDGRIELIDIASGEILNPNDKAMQILDGSREVIDSTIFNDSDTFHKILLPSSKHGTGKKVVVSNGYKQPIKPSKGRKVVVEDVLPHSIGFSDYYGVFFKVLEKQSTIPCKNSVEADNAIDNEKELHLKFYEGEDKTAKNNKFLHEYVIGNIPSCKAHEVTFILTLSINENGICSASAVPEDTKFFKNVQFSFSTK